MFGLIEGIAKATLGVVFSPINIAADLITMGGALTDRDEPYTVESFKNVMRNLNNAFDPTEYNDRQIQKIVDELNRKLKL